MKDLYEIIDELRAQWVVSQQSKLISGAGEGVKLSTPLYVDLNGVRFCVVGVKNIRGKITLEVSDEV